ncbi:MAG: hypothetical protein OEW68_00465 [Gammaproteobacteria bacterium]|nr:hypothetical protein [Gammaproteobacteria bacterium]MDH4313296.1 hypothetical protein [Gammaproteobacteria bacterium]MDH5212903.1 hypothetical protein [Gammaproteobacteria bacterium]
MATDRERINILLVEDCCSNVRLVRKALEGSNVRCRLQTVGVGGNTLNYLRKSSPYAEAPTPDLVFFDVSEARQESIELLEQIKADKTTKSIPLVLLTNQDSEAVLKELRIDRKDRTVFSPIDLESFLRAMNSFRMDRFLGAVRLIESLGFVLVSLPEAVASEQQTESDRSGKSAGSGDRRVQLA